MDTFLSPEWKGDENGSHPFCGTLGAVSVNRARSQQQHEAHVSTKAPETRPHPWLPQPQPPCGRPAGTRAAPPQGTRAHHGMTMTPRGGVPPRALVREMLAHGRRMPTPLGRFVLGRAAQRTGRIFVVVSRAVARRSTARNRLRRQLREWARREELGGRFGRDAVLLVRPDAATLTRRALRERMASTLAQLVLTRRSP